MDNRVSLIVSEIERLYNNGTLEELFYDYGGNMIDLEDFFNGFGDDNLMDELSEVMHVSNCNIKHGLQSISFIFEDIVYKLTPYDLSYINDFIEYLSEEEVCTELKGLSDLVCPVELVYNCKAFSIYSQKRLYFDNPLLSDIESPVYGILTGDLADSICSYYYDRGMCITYAVDVIKEFSDCFISFISNFSVLGEDIHNGNWAYDENGHPIIFDPFFFYEV